MAAQPISHSHSCKARQERNKGLLAFFGVGAALLLCCLCAEIMAFSYISLVLFLVYIVFQAFLNPKIVLKYLYFYFAVVSNVVGVAACELTTIYLPEMYIASHYAGSLPLIVFARWLFLELVRYLDCRFGFNVEDSGVARVWNGIAISSERDKYYRMLLDVLNCLVLGFSAALCIHLVQHPSFLLAVDRIEYAELYLTGLWGTISSYLSILIVVPIIRLRIKVNVISVIALVLYVASLFLSGVKFGSYFALICAFTIVYYDAIARMSLITLKRLFAMIFAVLPVLVFFSSGFQAIYSQIDPIEYLAARTAQQGELWWRTYDLFEVDPHFDQLEIELRHLVTDESVSNSVGEDYGIYGAMYRTVPNYYVDRYLSGGARYTEAGYAVSLYCLGIAGPMLFSAVAAIGTAVIQNGLVHFIAKGRLFSAILVYRLYLALCTALGMFTFGQLFSPVSLITYGFLMLVCMRGGASPRRDRVSLFQGGGR